MPWHTPVTVTTGQLLTATNWNEQVRDNISYLKDIAYVEFMSNVSVTGTAFVDIVSSGAITYAATPIAIEFYCFNITCGASGILEIDIRDGATDLGKLIDLNTSETIRAPFSTRTLTPTAGSHTYTISAKNGASQTSTVRAGAGGAGNPLPGFIRIRGIPS